MTDKTQSLDLIKGQAIAVMLLKAAEKILNNPDLVTEARLRETMTIITDHADKVLSVTTDDRTIN